MSTIKQFVFVLLGLIYFNSLQAEIKTVKHSKKNNTIKKWEVVDIAFKADVKNQNPFVIDFVAQFTDPNGKVQIVPGFYNGAGNWVVRFSASVAGVWTYETRSEIKTLNGKKGKLVVSNETSNEHKGGIVLNPEKPRNFFYENGESYFLTAFECDWLYALDYHNQEALPKTDHLLNLLHENGFNQVVMNVFSYDVSWKKDDELKEHPEHEYGAPKDIFPFLGNNENPDYSSLNVEFFKKLDRTIALMHDKNIVSHLMIYVWNKLVAWPEMNSDADNMYYDYVVKRYGAFPNVMWDVSKEALYYGRADDAYILERIKRLRENNSFNRLVTVHDYGFCKRHAESVDFISRQDWTYSLYTNMLDDYNKYSDKPVFNIEHGGYEESPYEVFTGSYVNAETCLKRNYQCVFAGVYSTYYWQAASWNVVVYNPYEQEEGFIKPKFEYFKYMTSLFSKFDFSKFKPTPWHNQAGYCLKSDDTYLFYVPKDTYKFRGEFLFKENESISLQWMNTLSGEYSELLNVNKKQDFESPWYNKADAVLIIKPTNKNK
ncbi:DUF5060 domain-containing protein [Labilibaculum antarcticum]|uniref:DUF5060 domain-containing protein n=1 Tax=Labilibaculum antarcticum TaxID=1717717 RepID=A0A1Y1CDM7_9BACT|nr:DUF5060 domain-containing protein [Labilibaculum antarcticum]BAX78435.1 hypothetical protein ALGA_0040 [Labilibaculum antarcticum]